MSQPPDKPSPNPASPSGLRVLVVDDEEALADLVGSYLTRDGYEVTMARDGRQAIDLARQVDPDVMVLDLGLPVIDGVEVCRVVRTFSDCYIIMLTARTDEVDKLIGLSVGADDYLTKPFSPRELLARIHAMLRRPRASTTTSGQPAQEAPPRVFGALSVDVAAREVQLDGEPVALTRTEFDLLEVLSARPKMVFSRRQLIDAVWDQSWVDEHLVDVHVGHLRRKLGDDPGSPRYVCTIRSFGYRMGDGR